MFYLAENENQGVAAKAEPSSNCDRNEFKFQPYAFIKIKPRCFKIAVDFEPIWSSFNTKWLTKPWPKVQMRSSRTGSFKNSRQNLGRLQIKIMVYFARKVSPNYGQNDG